jgi:hypothetical protein
MARSKTVAPNPSPNVRRVRHHRRKLREQGMRPVQIWVPDIHAPGFAEEALRQGRIVGATYAEDDTFDFFERIYEEDHPSC